MTDDWEKQYWAQKQQQANQQQGQRPQRRPEDMPHYEPLHVTQDRQRGHSPQQQRLPNDNWRDVDPMTARHTDQYGMATNALRQPQSVPMVMLREGAVYYKAVQVESFGTTTPMVRNCGPLEGVAGREFELKQETHCYVIDNMAVVDLGNVDPSKMIRLVEVCAPFIGSLLVDASAIIQGASGRGPQLLND